MLMNAAYSLILPLRQLPASAYWFTLVTSPPIVFPRMASNSMATSISARTSEMRDSLIVALICIWLGSGSRRIACRSRTDDPASTTNSALPPKRLLMFAYTTWPSTGAKIMQLSSCTTISAIFSSSNRSLFFSDSHLAEAVAISLSYVLSIFSFVYFCRTSSLVLAASSSFFALSTANWSPSNCKAVTMPFAARRSVDWKASWARRRFSSATKISLRMACSSCLNMPSRYSVLAISAARSVFSAWTTSASLVLHTIPCWTRSCSSADESRRTRTPSLISCSGFNNL